MALPAGEPGAGRRRGGRKGVLAVTRACLSWSVVAPQPSSAAPRTPFSSSLFFGRRGGGGLTETARKGRVGNFQSAECAGGSGREGNVGRPEGRGGVGKIAGPPGVGLPPCVE